MKLISVKDRLPTDTNPKLVYNKNEAWKGGIAEWNFARYDGTMWIIAYRGYWTQESITHWCDLGRPHD